MAGELMCDGPGVVLAIVLDYDQLKRERSYYAFSYCFYATSCSKCKTTGKFCS